MSELFNQVNQEKITLLNRFLREYTTSKDKVALYRTYESVLKHVTPHDLFHLEFFSNQTPLSIETIKDYANRYVNLFFHGLNDYPWNKHVHPVLEAFIAENEAIMAKLEALKPLLESKKIEQSVEDMKALLNELVVIDRKFIKVQNIVFPILEKKLPSITPFSVLWSVQDDILKDRLIAYQMLEQTDIDWPAFKVAIGKFYYGLAGMIQKEDLIVFPLASEVISLDAWDSMVDSLNEIGFAFIEPNFISINNQKTEDHVIKTMSGTLSIDQFILVMNHLPIEITYVDESDKVVYFNQPSERHFPRTPQVIGREVRYCHPPKSVHIVEKIIDAFKSGRQDQAQFWMSFKGKKILITYYAVRNHQNEYKGVLEVTQDISQLMTLEGEKRLLDWE